MSNENNTPRPVGIGFGGLLTIVFITLKLLDKIDWSWWWVLSPIWIGFGLVLLFFLIGIVVALIQVWLDK